MGRYKYSDNEKETLKVLKMQENQLDDLERGIQDLSSDADKSADDLAELRQRAEALLKNRGLTPPKKAEAPIIDTKIKIRDDEIPSWEEIATKARASVQQEVEFEDLLSKEEFQFCIDEVQRINDEFSLKTGILNKKDMSFLMIATALQTARWLIIQELFGDLGQPIDSSDRISSKDGDKLKHPILEKAEKRFGKHDNIQGEYPSWQEILWGTYPRVDGGKANGCCPYDAQTGAPSWFEEGGRGAHRIKSLGHDAIAGWIFGTANLMTQTITLSDFSSYKVIYPGNCFGEPISTLSVLFGAIESVKEDWMRLPAAIIAHYAHLKSDVFTNAGLPVPLSGILSENLAGSLYRNQYDSLRLIKDLKIVGKQASFSIIINMIIGLVHGLLYNPKKDGDRKLYEVRTRKILCISNALASSGNIAYAIVTEDWRKLDIGGILVTLYRLFTDVRFISRVKQDFIDKEMDKVLEKELQELDSYFI